jgi:hypothetical protein
MSCGGIGAVSLDGVKFELGVVRRVLRSDLSRRSWKESLGSSTEKSKTSGRERKSQ